MFRRNIGWVESIHNDIIRSIGTTGAGICAYRSIVYGYISKIKTQRFLNPSQAQIKKGQK
jgi:hypothetical protein